MRRFFQASREASTSEPRSFVSVAAIEVGDIDWVWLDSNIAHVRLCNTDSMVAESRMASDGNCRGIINVIPW